MEIIEHEGKTLAMIIRKNRKFDESSFITPEHYPLQAGILVYPKGHKVKAHAHNTVEKNVSATQEILFVKRGSAVAELFNSEGEMVAEKELNEGDIIFLADCGHGFRIKEDSEIFEIKQGPYAGHENDKRMLE